MILAYLQRAIRACRQHGFFATVKLLIRRLTDGISSSRAQNDTISKLYDSFLQKYNKGEIIGIAIIPSAFEFEDLYNQRTINLSKYLSDKNFGVIYVAWQWHKSEILQKNYQFVYKNVVQLPLYDFCETFEEIKTLKDITLKKFFITLPAEKFYDLLEIMRKNNFDIHYDIMDDWEGFYEASQAPWYKKNIEEAFVMSANKVTSVSAPLMDKFSYLRQDIKCIGNGYDKTLLGPCNIASKTFDNTIHLGYFGHLTAAWFDWPLIFDLLKKHNNLFLHIIGYSESEEIRKKISKTENINLIGAVSPTELHEYVSKWHIAIIPFKKLDLSEAVDPIKIYEYLHFGLPSVATGIPHLKDYPYVEAVDNNVECFYNGVVKLYEMKQQNKIDYKIVEEFLVDKTWEKRFEELLEPKLLSKLL